VRCNGTKCTIKHHLFFKVSCRLLLIHLHSLSGSFLQSKPAIQARTPEIILKCALIIVLTQAFLSLPTYTLACSVQSEIEVRKSRFIAFAYPVADRDAALRKLEILRDEYRTATHVCWALMAGGQSGMSDDGEPSGTAGRPILEVLRHHELDGVLAAVVRYYGGIKLGSGGLVRAYTDAIAGALKQTQRIERISYSSMTIQLNYADEARVRHWINQQKYTLTHSSHDVAATLVIQLPLSELTSAKKNLHHLTQGRVNFAA
jgi:uncharacterized YigZ family protein